MPDSPVADVTTVIACEDPETSKLGLSANVEIFTEESISAAKESANKPIMTSTRLSRNLDPNDITAPVKQNKKDRTLSTSKATIVRFW